MDYNEWLLDYYNVKVAPLTSTDGFSSVVALIAAGALISTFGSIVFGFYNDIILGAIMPTVSKAYEEDFFIPADAFLEDTIAPFLANYGLDAVVNIIDQIFEAVNYVIIDVVFAFLRGDLTRDPNYA